MKVSEAFLRLNSSDARWGHLGRIIMLQQCGSTVDATTPLPRADSGSLLNRAARLAAHQLHWQLHQAEMRRAGRRNRHLLQAAPTPATPGMSHCTSAPLVTFAGGQAHLAHDIWTGWGSSAAPLDVHVYTDGSYQPRPASSSAWSVVVGDRWFDDNFTTIPADEQQLTPAHVLGATLVGSSITCTQGVFPAELQAIARALAMLPLSFQLQVHSDSQASIASIGIYVAQTNERRRMRMAARPLLFLIHHLLTIREAAGGGVTFQHVHAHTTDTDIHSVGNRMADYQAERSRLKPDRSTPLTLQQLPLHECEPFLHVKGPAGLQVIDDVRRTSKLQLKAQALDAWQLKPDQGVLAGPGMIDLGRVVMKHGSPAQQAALVHLATNSIQYHWLTDPAGVSTLHQVQCPSCAATSEVMSILHVSSCPGAEAAQFRRSLRSGIIALLSDSPDTNDWLATNRRLELPAMMHQLFPPAAAASADQLQRHTALCFIGAFTASQSNAAEKQLGIPVSKARPSTLERLRLLCVEHFDQAYTRWKAPP